MKKYVIFIALFCLCCSVSAQAQPKFGHINVQELIELMPDRDSAVITYQKYVADLEETYAGIQNEYKVKVLEYQQKQATWSAAVQETKGREIGDIEQRLQQFSQSAQQEMEQQYAILFAPVSKKANDAIKKVGKELGLLCIFNTPNMPYIDESQSVDILAKVKAELKIPAEKVAPTNLNPQPQR